MPIAIRNGKIILSSEKKTEELASQFFQKLKPGNTIFLYGEIGVGKTTFIRYLINQLQKKNNVKITEVTSPTFNLLNEYQINDIIVKHYDLFRLKHKSEIINLDIFDNNEKFITFIEWPELIDKKLIKTIDLNFLYENKLNNRSVTINGLT